MWKNKLKDWLRSEIFCIIAISCLFLFSFSNILISKVSILSHDSIDWYGIFQYFCDSIYKGSWPLWNPYTHAGEPFYYNYIQKQMLEPVTLICVSIGKLFKMDILTLYHWTFFMRLLFMNLGIYLFLRRFYKYLFTKMILFTLIVLSSLSLTCLRLMGILEVLYWTPWILFALFRVLEEENTFNWILLALFTGLSFSQYGVVYSLSFFFVLLLTFLVKNRTILQKKIYIFERRNLKLLFLFFLIIIALASPLWTTFLFDIGKIVPVARMLDGTTKGLFLTLGEISQKEDFWRGATTLQDLWGLINPYFPAAFLKGYYSGYVNNQALSESFLYLGILPLFLAIYGIFFCRHKYKFNFLILLIVIGSLMLGTKFIFFRIFFYLFPLIRVTRHAMQFFPFFLLTLYYFTGLGLDHLVDKYEKLRLELKIKKIKHPLISKALILRFFFVCIFFFAFYVFGEKVSPEIRYLTYFYGLCIFFLLLLIRALSIARFGKIILVVFIITDLFIFNYFNRPLMLNDRKIPFSTKAEAIRELPEKRIFDVADYSPMPRLKSLLFRSYSIEKNFYVYSSSFFELKNFYILNYVPDNNLEVLAGVSQPIIKFYQKVLPFRNEYYYKYFLDPKGESILRTVLFIDDAKTIASNFFYHNDYEKNIPEDSAFDYKILKYNPSDVKIEIHVKNKGFLYFSDGYDEYWHAYLDSKQTTLYRANINFKAVMVPSGTHTIRFIYRPVFHIFSLWLYFLTLLGALLYVLCYLLFFKKIMVQN